MRGRTIHGIILLTFLLGLVAHPAWGQADGEQKPAPPRSCPELSQLALYLEVAALNNPELEAAFNRWKASLERAPQVSALPDPRFTFAYYIKEVETRIGPQNYRLGLAQSFPWLGKLDLMEEQALLEAKAAKARYEALKWKVFTEVKQAYFEYAYLAQALRIAEENVAILRYLEQVTAERYAAGAAPFAAVIDVQVELGRVLDRLRSLEDLRGPTAARLNAAMNRPLSEPIPWPNAVPVMLMSPTLEKLREQLPGTNPTIQALSLIAEAALKGQDLAYKDYYPDLTFGIETIITGESEVPNPPADSGQDALIASLTLNLPIWLEKRRAAVNEAGDRRLAALRDRAAQVNQLGAALETAHYKYRDAARQVGLYRDTLIPQARQSLEVTLEAFQSGTRSAADLMMAERTLLEFELNHTRALADQAQQFAVAEQLVGSDIDCTLHGSALPSFSLTAPASTGKRD